MDFSWAELWQELQNKKLTQVLSLNPSKSDYFWKHFIGGAFITIAMTGLDQEMMQKNISVKTLKDAQKNMVVFSFTLLVVNALFLLLGSILSYFAFKNGLDFAPDDLFPKIIQTYLPSGVFIIFIIGLISALFPSVDGAITALTSSFCIDILGLKERSDLNEDEKVKVRTRVHLGVAVVFLIAIVIFRYINEGSVITAILKIAGYTYGPLLGLFAFGMLTKQGVKDKLVPLVCVLSPILTFILDKYSIDIFWGYQMGFEVLLVNGLITFLGLLLISYKKQDVVPSA